MKKTVKTISWIILLLLGCVLAAYMILLVVNRNDKPASDAAIRLQALTASLPPVADNDNAYVYFMGFSIDQHEDPVAWGMERIRWAQEQVAKPVVEPGVEYPGDDFSVACSRSDIVHELIDDCRYVGPACLSLMSDHENEIKQWLEDEAWILERYQQLLSYPAWLESVPLDYNLPFPDYSRVAQAHMMLLSQAWLAANDADVKTVHALLNEDLRFWRTMLSSSDHLLSKMVATVALNRHFTLGSAILRKLPPEQVEAAVPNLWRMTLTDAERSILRTMRGEWRLFTRTAKQVREHHLLSDPAIFEDYVWLLLLPTLQVQHSSNQYAELLLAADEKLHVPYSQYPRALEQAQALFDEAIINAATLRLYNLMGDYWMSFAGLGLETYAARVADVEGVRRLALLSTDLHARNVESEQVSQELLKSALRDPYTGEPFRWNEASSTIEFQGLVEGESGRYVIEY